MAAPAVNNLPVAAIIFDCFGVLYVDGGKGRYIRNHALLSMIPHLCGRYKTALLSNSGRQSMDSLFTPEEQITLFDTVVLSGEVNVSKPDPVIFRLIGQRLGVGAARCLLIDDNQDNCQAAEGVGMRAIRFTGQADMADHLASFGIVT